MTIHKTSNLIETYRAKSKAKEINELTGRVGRPDLTDFVINQIVTKFDVQPATVVVDIGCGDGLFLQKIAAKGIDGYRGRILGILPTKEEVSRVRNHLLCDPKATHVISIELGRAEASGLPDDFADLLICNSVLHGGGQTIDNVRSALTEFRRIMKPGGKLFIGEMPDSNEMAGRNYGDSITSWLLWTLKNQGVAQFWMKLKQTSAAMLSNEPFVIGPKNIFFIPPANFIEMLGEYDFCILEHYRHKEIDPEGKIFESPTRWDYVSFKADRQNSVD